MQNICFEKHLRNTKASKTLVINQASKELEANNRQVVKFGFGQSPFPVPQHVTDELISSAARKEYMAVQGHPPLREAIANFHSNNGNIEWDADDIVVGAGSKILLFCIMASYTKANVLLPAPSWVSYGPQAELAGHDVTWLTTSFESSWKITAAELASACANQKTDAGQRILILNYPSNPTGQVYSKNELIELAAVIKENEIICIADEIYGFLTFNEKLESVAEFASDNVITTSGLSKWCGAGGWRLGYAHFPKALSKLKNCAIGIASETYSCAPSPVQLAATIAYSDCEKAKQFLKAEKEILSQAAITIANTLREAGVSVHDSQGGFYLFPDFNIFSNKLQKRGITTSTEFTETVLKEIGVALLSGSAFGMPDDSITTRLAFVDFDGEQALSTQDYSEIFKKMNNGIDRLCEWLQKL